MDASFSSYLEEDELESAQHFILYGTTFARRVLRYLGSHTFTFRLPAELVEIEIKFLAVL